MTLQKKFTTILVRKMNKRVVFKKAQEEINAEEFFKKNIIVPRFHDDDRRRSVNDIFQTPKNFGDLNISYIYKDRTVAWHRHLHQSDYWFVVKGSLKVGLYDEEAKKLMWVYLNENQKKVLHIPPKIWHGWRNIDNEESVLLYWITNKYDQKNPDEERATVGAFGEIWETPIK